MVMHVWMGPMGPIPPPLWSRSCLSSFVCPLGKAGSALGRSAVARPTEALGNEARAPHGDLLPCWGLAISGRSVGGARTGRGKEARPPACLAALSRGRRGPGSSSRHAPGAGAAARRWAARGGACPSGGGACGPSRTCAGLLSCSHSLSLQAGGGGSSSSSQ